MGHSFGFHISLWNAYFLILLGIAVVVLDLFTVLFLTPIGVALILWGILDIIGAPALVSGIVAILTLIVGYYLYLKFAQSVKQGQDFGSISLIGKEGIIKEISDDGSFIVEVDFDLWVAIPANQYRNYDFRVGMPVVVEGIDGVKLIVKPKE